MLWGGVEFWAYILRREVLQGNGSSPQGFQLILGLNFSRLKLYAFCGKAAQTVA